MIRSAMIALTACLLATSLAQAAGGGQQGPSMSNIVVQSVNVPTPTPEHSAVVPGIDPPSGGNSGEIGFPAKTRNHPKGGSGDDSSSGDDVSPAGTQTRRGPGDIALLCEIEPNGDFVLVNRGSRVVPQGAKIRWKAGSDQGFFALNVDLEPGAHATARDHSEAHGAPCLAALL